VAESFPGAFIIAFKNGEKIDVNAGIREFKNNRSTK
jgi:N-acetylmuramoyl-L-alanine amidase